MQSYNEIADEVRRMMSGAEIKSDSSRGTNPATVRFVEPPSDSSDDAPNLPQKRSFLPAVPEETVQPRNPKGQFRPLAGRGGKEDWPLYKAVYGLTTYDKAGGMSKELLLIELSALAEVVCRACHGFGHTKEHCRTEERLAVLRKPAVFSGLLVEAAAEVDEDRRTKNAGDAPYRRLLVQGKK